jgi:hypothetical protein
MPHTSACSTGSRSRLRIPGRLGRGRSSELCAGSIGECGGCCDRHTETPRTRSCTRSAKPLSAPTMRRSSPAMRACQERGVISSMLRKCRTCLASTKTRWSRRLCSGRSSRTCGGPSPGWPLLATRAAAAPPRDQPIGLPQTLAQTQRRRQVILLRPAMPRGLSRSRSSEPRLSRYHSRGSGRCVNAVGLRCKRGRRTCYEWVRDSGRRNGESRQHSRNWAREAVRAAVDLDIST